MSASGAILAELGLRRFTLQKLQVVDHQNVDAAKRFLEGQRRLALERSDEAVHEFFRGEVENLALVAGIAGPSDGLQKVGFAESHTRMDIERVEHDGIAASAFGDLTRRGISERVGAAGDEACESQARIERRTAERIVARGDWRGRRRLQIGMGPAIARLDTSRIGRHCWFLRRSRAAHGRPHRQIDPVNVR